MTTRRWVALVALAVLILAATSGYIFRQSVLTAAGRYLDVSAPDVHADIAFILGGGRSSRADCAFGLYREDRVKRILLAGAGPPAEVDGVTLLSEQEILYRMLLALGAPEDAIERLPQECPSTEAEIQALGKYVSDRGDLTVAIVTNDYHTRRCLWMVERTLGKENAAGRVQLAGCPSGTARADTWWKTPEGFLSYGMEWIKVTRLWLLSFLGA